MHKYLATLLLFFSVTALATDSYNATTNILNIDAVIVNGMRYNHVVLDVTGFSVLSVESSSTPNYPSATDAYNAITNILNIGAVIVNGVQYNHVVLDITGFSVLSVESSQVSGAECNQTINPGADLAAAVLSAAGGATLCLNSGDYGTVTLANIKPSSTVTIQSAIGVGAMMSLNVSDSSHLTFQNLTLNFLNMWGDPGLNTYVSVLNNTFSAGGSGNGQMQFAGNGSQQHNIISGNIFNAISVCSTCYEGRLQIYGGGDLVVSYNVFSGAGNADGIQLGGTGTIIGPNNVFTGLVQGSNSVHADAIQLYGQVDGTVITGNYFTNDSVYIGVYDGATNITITNNVFGPQTSGGSGQTQLLAVVGGVYNHNTNFSSFGVLQGAKIGETSTQNISYTNNIFIGNSVYDGGGDIHGCSSGCVYNNNLFDQNILARGTSNIIGTPAFAGGADSGTWGGYALISSSIGYQSATDGNDVGSNYFGVGALLPVVTLTNMRLICCSMSKKDDYYNNGAMEGWKHSLKSYLFLSPYL